MFSLKDEIRERAKQLCAAGHGVTSGWLHERKDPQTDLYDVSKRFSRDHAVNDIADIVAADALALFTVEPTQKTKRGGRHVEFGYALALGKQIKITC